MTLFSWSEDEFVRNTRGSAIGRIGYDRWLRNVAVALGNAPSSADVVAALRARLGRVSAMVQEHVEWALAEHSGRPAAAAR